MRELQFVFRILYSTTYIDRRLEIPLQGEVAPRKVQKSPRGLRNREGDFQFGPISLP